MTTLTPFEMPPPTARAEATVLALRLAHAENALRTLTTGQVDAIVDPDGHTYLLRPAQEQLRKNERLLQAVLDSSADVITVVSRGGTILSQSRAARQMLGYEPAELVGRDLFDFVHEDDLPAVHSAFFGVIELFRAHAAVAFRHRKSDGSWRMLEATAGVLLEANGASVVWSFRPASPQLPTRPALPLPTLALPRHPDRFLAMLSHELRTPLAPVLLGVAELEEDERFAAAAPVFSMMRRNLELQIRLLDELTEFVTVGEHKAQMRMERLDAHEHVRFVLEICQSDLAAAQIEVRLALRAPHSGVWADSVRLQQVMWNLLKNAAKFSPPGSSITITSTNESSASLTLEFADQGMGIDPQLLPLLFDPFQQGDHVTRQQHGGLGLGLFIAKGLVEAQGGTLTAFSEGRGKGAMFRLSLATAQANLAPRFVAQPG